jgi:predicted nucleotidyltransferase
MNTALLTALDAATEIIVKEVNPTRIVLFGSQARGDAGEESDIDLLIIVGSYEEIEESRFEILTSLYGKLSKVPYAIDLLLASEKEASDWRPSLNHPFGRALREGRVVYERP